MDIEEDLKPWLLPTNACNGMEPLSRPRARGSLPFRTNMHADGMLCRQRHQEIPADAVAEFVDAFKELGQIVVQAFMQDVVGA